MLAAVITSILGLVICVLGATDAMVVETPFGKLQGAEVTAKNHQKYLSFTGIPYAKPPVGPLRFAKPEPHPPLDGTFDATKNASYCPHPSNIIFLEDTPPGTEDCLHLNVYVKSLDPPSPSTISTKPGQHSAAANNKRKVLVWIHGGGFIVGGGRDYVAGTFVTTQDVIVVTINYRLGVLGFLSTEDEASPGNFGLWDQVMAIRWVKDNIAAFGGDPYDITIAGESAGSASVSFLSVTPVTRGLFTKVFAMSGTGTSVFATAKDPQGPALEVAKLSGCLEETADENKKLPIEETKKIVSCLRELPLEALTKFAAFAIERALFVPRVDGDFLPLHASELLRNDEYLESIGFFERTYLFGVDNSEKAVMDGAVHLTEDFLMKMEGKSEEEKAAMVDGFREKVCLFYTGSRLGMSSPSGELVDKISSWYERRITGQTISELATDLNFLVPTYDYLYIIAKSKTTDAYFFYFNYFPAFMQGKYRGIAHGADLAFWFDIDLDFLEKILHAGIAGELDQDDLELKVKFSDMIGQFINTGNPGNGLQDELPGGWPTFDLHGQHYLDFNLRPVVRRHLEREKRDLWLTSVPAWVAAAGSASSKP